jgi:hypothetical protein
MSQFGMVRQVRMTPKSTFAFVEYETVEEAVAAVNKCQGLKRKEKKKKKKITSFDICYF